MRYLSTRGTAPALGFEDVVLAGLASDGGLYVPESIPHISTDTLKQWASLEDALKFTLKGSPDLADKLAFAAMAPHATWVVPFHLAFDVFVLAAAWWAGRRA